MTDKDDERFHEIDDEHFDDSENLYFPFRESSVPEDAAGDEAYEEFSDMMLSFFSDFVSLLPLDIQDYARNAFDALTTQGCGEPEESNRILKAMRKEHKDIPGLYLMEARNCKSIAVSMMHETGREEELAATLRKERKALSEYIRRSDDADILDFQSYLWARAERSKVSLMLGDAKGAFSAIICLPHDTGFSMERLMDELDSYYMNDDEDEYSDNWYRFLSEADNAIQIEYSDPFDIIDSIVDPGHASEYVRMMNDSGMTGPMLMVTVDAGKDINSAAVDMQQVLAACLRACPEAECAYFDSFFVDKELLKMLLDDTEDGYFCGIVMYRISVEGDVAKTNSLGVWGRKELSLPVEPFSSPAEAAFTLAKAAERHVSKALKPGSAIEVNGRHFTVGEGNGDLLDLKA